ncbi:MAG: class I mannose-6-phosphate isomerase [Prevotellaceae bacterium]|jgi:mannose-6-phosphate isomerase|nr:class I mannose-6-phosphate isomerase [Prevotellaceae bacterium]
MTPLYPLKFKPQAKATVWGGNKLKTLFNKPFQATEKIGESWELSAVQRNLSVVTNGFLKGNTIEELAEVYLGELVGEKNYERFGIEFPILVKLIDASETLSVQVHPDDETARIRHNAYGKTEMWHVLQADRGAGLYVGFNRNLTATEFYERIQNNTLLETLNFVNVQPGDTFFITPGTIHAIGKGIVLAEIQQTSDITYRIYDWGREHNPATARAMHVEQAIDIIDYTKKAEAKIDYATLPNEPVQLVESPYFVTNLVEINRPLVRNLSDNDSFVIYVCIDGDATIQYNQRSETITKGETLLVPAAIADFTLLPSPKAKLLEAYM